MAMRQPAKRLVLEHAVTAHGEFGARRVEAVAPNRLVVYMLARTDRCFAVEVTVSTQPVGRSLTLMVEHGAHIEHGRWYCVAKLGDAHVDARFDSAAASSVTHAGLSVPLWRKCRAYAGAMMPAGRAPAVSGARTLL